MISSRKRFLFVHVPKTGGNSLQNLLKEHSEDRIVTLTQHQDGLERFEVRSDRGCITKHSTLTDYRRMLQPGTFSSLFKFATIRNPWDKMVSSYFSPHRGASGWNRKAFLDLVHATPTLRHFIVSDPYRWGIARLLPPPFRGRPRPLDADIDLLLRFEHLDEDWRSLCARLDIPLAPLPVRNRSQRDHYSRYYDEESLLVVAERFSEEIAFGGYRFESP